MKAFAFALLLAAIPALADGPHIALHGSQGPYTMTLFTAPNPLVAGKAEFALLVTRGESGPVVPVRKAGVLLKSDGGSVEVDLKPGDGGITGSAVLSRPGQYAITVLVEPAPGTSLQLAGTLPVLENHGRRDTVLWAVLFPVVAILIFLANQSAKQRLRSAPKV